MSKNPKSKYDTSSNRKVAGIGLVLGYIGASLFIIFISGFTDSHPKKPSDRNQDLATNPAFKRQRSIAAEVSEASTPALGTAERLELDLKTALRTSNRDVERVSKFDVQNGTILVTFAMNDNLTEGWITTGAYIDIRDVLKAIQSSQFPYTSVSVEGTFSLVDKFGNTSEDVVVRATYYRSTVDKINWANFLTDNVIEIADSAWTHPAMSN